jgi:hypothetical protein
LKVVTVFGTVTNRQLQQQLDALTATVDILMTKADRIMTEDAAVAAVATDIETQVAALTAATATLQGANPALDLTGLNQAVADLGTATAAEQAVVPPPAG